MQRRHSSTATQAANIIFGERFVGWIRLRAHLQRECHLPGAGLRFPMRLELGLLRLGRATRGRCLHEPAHMQRHRTAARGNATLFPLPLEDIVQELDKIDSGRIAALPRLGEDLAPFVKVLLKSAGDLPKSIITQATVRRRVAVALSQECHRRGHPAYRHIDLHAMLMVC